MSVRVFGLPLITREPHRTGQTDGRAQVSRSGSGPGGGLRRVLRLWSLRRVLRRASVAAARFIGRLLRLWRLESGLIALHVGADDPALVGVMTGYFHAVRAGLRRRWPQLEWSWRPEFGRTVLEVEGVLTYRIIPWGMVAAAIRMVWDMPWRGLYKLKKAWA